MGSNKIDKISYDKIQVASQSAPHLWRDAVTGAGLGAVGGVVVSAIYESAAISFKKGTYSLPSVGQILSSSIATVAISATYFGFKGYRESARTVNNETILVQR